MKRTAVTLPDDLDREMRDERRPHDHRLRNLVPPNRCTTLRER